MSEVAGRMAIQIGSTYLLKPNGGKGVLMSGVPGTRAAEVVIIGGGIAGLNAAKVALGMGAKVTVLEISKKRMMYLDDIFGGKVSLLMNTSFNIAEAVKKADLLISAVLIPGAKSPLLVTEDMVKTMEPGSVIIDIAVDQGGSIETIDRATTHENPTYVKHGVIHYSVANMPGAVPQTSTYALTGITLQYLKRMLSSDIKEVLSNDKELRLGLNTYMGKVTNEGVAEALGCEYTNAMTLL
jgi:alanine dehydrogenase